MSDYSPFLSFEDVEAIKTRWRTRTASDWGDYKFDAVIEAICEQINLRMAQLIDNADTQVLERASVALAQRVIDREKAG